LDVFWPKKEAPFCLKEPFFSGYGFIEHPDGGEDIFVHYSNIISDQELKFPKQSTEVEFDIEDSGKGLQAKNVHEIRNYS